MTGDRLPRERGMWLGRAGRQGWGGESQQPMGRHRGVDRAQQAGPGRRWPDWIEGVKGQEGELGWQATVEAHALL